MNGLHNLQDKIDYIFENNDALYTLVGILVKEEEEAETKTEIVQLLAALCAYPGGLSLVLKALEIWKDKKNDRYRFEPLVNEISDHHRSIKDSAYVTTLTILVNCMLASCDSSVEDRVRLRNELCGLRLQATFDKLRMVPALCDHAELQKQLDTFDERKMADEAHLSGPEGVDLNNHADIFDAIMKQVAQKPHDILFLNILQHLLQIDSRDSLADLAWEAAEKLVCRAKLIASKEEADKLLRTHTLSVDNNNGSRCQCNNSNNAVNNNTSGNGNTFADAIANAASQFGKNKTNNGIVIDSNSSNSVVRLTVDPSSSHSPSNGVASSKSTAPPPPPALTVNGGGPPVPPPLPPQLFNFRKSSPSSSSTSANGSATAEQELLASSTTKLAELPLPKHKLKTFAWNKLPLGKIVNNGDNLWSKAAKRNFDASYSLDFDSLEMLFCQNLPGSSASTLERKNSASKKRETNEVNLLDSKRSLNVNIFLRQFKGEIQDLVELITTGDGTKIGMEKLRSLIKLMPESDEIETLTQFTDDKSKLGTAEKFFLALISVDNYQLRIECMLLKEEFATIIDYIRPSVQAIINAANELKNNRSLQDVMYLVLMVGNYLNSGSYGGNAAGFKMTSLWKLMEIRANKPNMTLLHYVVMETDKNNPSLLAFPHQMKHLEEASKLSIDSIVSDFRSLKEKTERITRQLSPNICLDVWNQMSEFLEIAKRDLFSVQRKLDDMERLRFDLATFFCEDPQSFKLEDCFKIFHHFCTRFSKAIDENNERKMQEEKVELRRKLKEQQLNASRDLSPYDNGSSPFVRSSYERRSLNTSRSHELLDVLNRSRDSLDAEDTDPITNSKVRRSLRRRVSAMNDMMTTNDRERPAARPWRQRLEELMAEDSSGNDSTNGNVSSDQQKSKHRFSLNLNTADNNGNESSASSVECSAIYAKTFAPSGRVETARISSVSDVRRPMLLTPDENRVSPTVASPLATHHNEPSKATWRLDREKRSQSLYMGLGAQNGSCAEDLNELLQTLEAEKKQHDRMIIGRRYSRNSYRGNEGGDESQTANNSGSYHRSWSNTPKQENNGSTTDLGRKYSGDNSNDVTPAHRLYPNSSLLTPETEPNGFVSWRDRIKEEVPDYVYTASSIENQGDTNNNNNNNNNNNPSHNNATNEASSTRSSIDEVVRHVERTREEIEQFALTLDAEKIARQRCTDQLDSGIDLRCNGGSSSAFSHPSNREIISQGDLREDAGHVEEPPTECEPSTTECVVDFTLPSAYNEPICNALEQSERLDIINPELSLNLEKPLNNVWHHNRSPRSPEDQSDARSTESPTESVADRDEGFETESTNTVCNEPSPTALKEGIISSPRLSSSDMTKAVIDRPRPRPNFMSITKSSSTRNNNLNGATNNSIDKQTASKPKNTNGTTFLKRAIDSVSNKNTQTTLTTRSQPHGSSSTFSKLPATTTMSSTKRAVLSRSSTNASSMSSGSSSRDERPTTAAATVKPAVVAGKQPTAMKAPRTTVSKQKQIQIRSRVEALKEAASSSDSERTVSMQQKHVVPSKLSKSLKVPATTNSQVRKSSLPGNSDRKTSAPANNNDKTFQRLMSPPKSRLSRPSSSSTVLVKNMDPNNNGVCKPPVQQNGSGGGIRSSGSARSLVVPPTTTVNVNKKMVTTTKAPGMTGQNGHLVSSSSSSNNNSKRAASLEPAQLSKTTKASWR